MGSWQEFLLPRKKFGTPATSREYSTMRSASGVSSTQVGRGAIIVPDPPGEQSRSTVSIASGVDFFPGVRIACCCYGKQKRCLNAYEIYPLLVRMFPDSPCRKCLGFSLSIEFYKAVGTARV